jgi:hypothetical protein
VCEVEGAPGDGDRILPAAGQEMRLAEIGQEERMVGCARHLGVRERLFHEGQALREAARHRIRVPEMRGRDVKVISAKKIVTSELGKLRWLLSINKKSWGPIPSQNSWGTSSIRLRTTSSQSASTMV